MDGKIDYNLVTITAEKLNNLRLLDAALALSHTLTSGITMSAANNAISLEEVKPILQRNYTLQAQIFSVQGGRQIQNVPLEVLQSLNGQGSDPKAAE